jgi:prepilin-type N-terminal cleavage/methylation domain-containing protein
MMQRLRKIIKKQAGFTLIELMIALAITGIITGASTMIVFQVFDGEARSNNHMDVISRVQNVGCQVSRDAGMAQSMAWAGEGDDDGFPLTLTWTEWENNDTHQVVYTIEDNKLKRVHTINGNPAETYVFEYIIGADPDDLGVPVTYFAPDTHTSQLVFTLTATVGFGSQRVSETRRYRIVPRSSL